MVSCVSDVLMCVCTCLGDVVDVSLVYVWLGAFFHCRTGSYALDSAIFSSGSGNLVRRLLALDPASRLTAKQVLEHPWMLEEDSLGTTDPTPLRDPSKSPHPSDPPMPCTLCSAPHHTRFRLTEMDVADALKRVHGILEQMGLSSERHPDASSIVATTALAKGTLVVRFVVEVGEKDCIVSGIRETGDSDDFHAGFHDLVRLLDAPLFKK